MACMHGPTGRAGEGSGGSICGCPGAGWRTSSAAARTTRTSSAGSMWCGRTCSARRSTRTSTRRRARCPSKRTTPEEDTTAGSIRALIETKSNKYTLDVCSSLFYCFSTPAEPSPFHVIQKNGSGGICHGICFPPLLFFALVALLCWLPRPRPSCQTTKIPCSVLTQHCPVATESGGDGERRIAGEDA